MNILSFFLSYKTPGVLYDMKNLKMRIIRLIITTNNLLYRLKILYSAKFCKKLYSILPIRSQLNTLFIPNKLETQILFPYVKHTSLLVIIFLLFQLYKKGCHFFSRLMVYFTAELQMISRQFERNVFRIIVCSLSPLSI